MTFRVQAYSRVTEVTTVLSGKPDKAVKEKKKNHDFARLLSAALEKDKKTSTDQSVDRDYQSGAERPCHRKMEHDLLKIYGFCGKISGL